MKALFLKDVHTLKASKALLIVIIGVTVLMAIWGGQEGVSFIVSYVMVLCAVVAVNAMNYDEMDNGYAFLLTLPFSRKQYVLEKYLFSFAIGFCGWLLTMILGAVVASGFGAEKSWSFHDIWWTLYGGTFAAFLVVQAVMIPIQLKFGGQKGKIAMFAIIAAGCGITVILRKVPGMEELAEILSEATNAQLGAGSFILVAACLSVSFLCSVKIMERKEF
ncbi:ABC-2 transporter permease [Clostridiales bacterium]|nr:ABC-2 transporter permease [Clostridiales bacterium]